MNNILWITCGLILLASCGQNNSSSNVKSPGSEKTAKDKVLQTGADILQSKTPLRKINAYLDGFHFYNGNVNAQMEAHHYVSQLNEDLYQAIIYDGNGEDAKLMGIEYIISAKLFTQLPTEEKTLWHSHKFEVKSGLLVAPGIPNIAEHELMEKLASTYGKTIHTWHTDQDRVLPIGSPMIMMGFTKDGQIHPQLVEERDKRLKLSTAAARKNREDIKAPEPLPGANAWQEGKFRQFIISDQVDSALTKHQMK